MAQLSYIVTECSCTKKNVAGDENNKDNIFLFHDGRAILSKDCNIVPEVSISELGRRTTKRSSLMLLQYQVFYYVITGDSKEYPLSPTFLNTECASNLLPITSHCPRSQVGVKS